MNGGRDLKTREQVGPAYAPITGEYLDYEEVIQKYDVMRWTGWQQRQYTECDPVCVR